MSKECEETGSGFIDELIQRLIKDKPKNFRDEKINEFLGCPKNKQTIVGKTVPGYLAGLYSLAVESIIKNQDFFITNLSREGEQPPRYTNCQTGHGQEANYLLEGFYFIKQECPMVIGVEPVPMAFSIEVYLPKNKKSIGIDFLKEIDIWAKKNNFYKGKAIEAKRQYGDLYFDFLAPINKNWDDIILSKTQIDEISENILVPIEHSDIMRNLNKTATRGVLFIGKPGTGKTLFLKILCEEVKSHTRIWVSSSTLSGSVVSQIFDAARDLKPSILILEDFDLVGRDREVSNSESLGNLLMELDGQKSNDDLIILITSNNPKTIDNALMRPGRIDRTIEFLIPDEHQRYSLLKLFLKEYKSNIDIKKLAKETDGYTGADLKELVTSAILRAIRREPKNPQIVDSDFKSHSF